MVRRPDRKTTRLSGRHRTEAAGCVPSRSGHSPGESSAAWSRELMGTLAGQNRRGQKGQDILEAPSSCPQRCRLRPPTLTQTPPAHGETGQRKIQGQAQGSAEAHTTSARRDGPVQDPGTGPGQRGSAGRDETCHCGRAVNPHKFQTDQEGKHSNVFIII